MSGWFIIGYLKELLSDPCTFGDRENMEQGSKSFSPGGSTFDYFKTIHKNRLSKGILVC